MNDDVLISPEEQLRFLRKAYQANLPERIRALKDIWITSSRGRDIGVLKNLTTALHNLTGSSATFGYREVSTLSHQLELIVSSLVVSQSSPDELLAETIENAFEKIENVFSRTLLIPTAITAEKTFAFRKKEYRDIFLISIPKDETDTYAKGISAYGYNVIPFSDLDVMNAALEKSLPGACIFDFTTEMTINHLMKKPEDFTLFSQAPSIILSPDGSFEFRLQSVRAGAEVFLKKPVPPKALALCLDIITGSHLTDNQYRVLIIENDPEQAMFFAMILQMAGMHASILFNPQKILNPVDQFKPELILMNLYLDGCSGIELASVIRQSPRRTAIPIVFLSNSDDESRQFSTAHFGADDLLTKPVKIEHLISSVENHIRRYRTLQSVFRYDAV